MIKYLFLATGLFLLTNPLQAVDAAHCKSHHKSSESKPIFLYASTPLDYIGQNVGTAPVLSGTTVQVNFPVIGDTSQIIPVSENETGIFTVLRRGHYLINWNMLVQNFDGGGFNTAFEIVILQNSNPQPPNPKFNIPPAFGQAHNPNCASVSGSILLPLEVGDLVQLNITSLSSTALTIPLVVKSAAINFIRLSEI